MKNIYRFDVPIEDRFCLHLPVDAQVLSVSERGGTAHMWILLSPEKKIEERHFRVIGTGRPIPDAANLRFVGTVLLSAGRLVWHVFEVE